MATCRQTDGSVPAIDIERVTKRFTGGEHAGGPFWRRKRKPFVAVDGVTLRVEPGEVFGLLGANGSGKSTLIRLIATLLFPDEGAVRVFGHDVVKERQTARRLLNRVSVEASFFKKLSAVENLLYAGRLYNLSGREARARTFELLGRLGLTKEKIRSPLEQMSRGMQQKVAIARALMTSPRILLLDEPTTGLDPKSKRDVQQLVAGMRADDGVTVLLTTHDMQEAEKLCDRVAILDGGRIIAAGTAAELRAGLKADGASLEDVFLELVGREWEEEEEA